MPKPEKAIPANLEAEEAVLGSILIDPDALTKVGDRLKASDFYREKNAWIYQAICDLRDGHQAIDYLTLIDALDRKGILNELGGSAYLTTLIDGVPTAINAEYYAEIVRRTATLRGLISAAGEIAALAYDESRDLGEVIDRSERLIFEIAERGQRTQAEDMPNVMNRVMDRLVTLSAQRGQVLGVPTGFTGIDRLLGGFQPSDLIILAARPGIGKTSLALNCASNASRRHNKRVGIFSLEMSNEQLVQRLLAAETGVDQQRLRLGDIKDHEWPLLVQGADVIGHAPLYIDDTAGLSISDLRARARRMKAERHIDLLIVDYLQLMHGDSRSENRNQEISYITRSLKMLARELSVPLLCLSQLSRAAEDSNEPPQLRHLRDSGAIEADADVVMFLHVPNPDTDPNIVNCIVAKHRNGPTDTVPLYFKNELTKFADLEIRRTYLEQMAYA